MKIGDKILVDTKTVSSSTTTRIIVGFLSNGKVVYEYNHENLQGIQVHAIDSSRVTVIVPKKRGWINIYLCGSTIPGYWADGGGVYATKEQALEMARQAGTSPVDTIEIEFKAE